MSLAVVAGIAGPADHGGIGNLQTGGGYSSSKGGPFSYAASHLLIERILLCHIVARGNFFLNQEHDMKKKQFMRVLLVCCMSCFVSNVCRADQAEEEAAIRKNDDAYVEAYNKHDAKALAEMWSPEAVYVDPETGEEAIGREEIEKEFAETFEGLKDAKLEIDVESIKFLSPNVAIESGTARVVRPNEQPDESTYSALFVKRDGKWLLDRVTEDQPPAPPAPPPSNYEHLKDLEWMVGSWIDNDEDGEVRSKPIAIGRRTRTS